ncbi:MAG: hypothetical protein WCK80_01985 [bacterium]
MNNSNNNLSIITKVLEAFGVAGDVKPDSIENLKVIKSKDFGMCDVFKFDFNNAHYYISNDYSLDDDPKYFREILLNINHLLTGEALKNPKDGEEQKYSVNIEDTQYYLWKNSK